MPTIDQGLTCSQGDSFAFAITVLPYADGSQPDLTGATASWYVTDGNFAEAEVLLTKDTPPNCVSQDDAGKWQVVVGLEPDDTIGIPPGIYYHQARVHLATGDVSHIEAGAFVLRFSGVP